MKNQRNKIAININWAMFYSILCVFWLLWLLPKWKKNSNFPTNTFLLHSRCLRVRCQRESVRLHRKHLAIHTPNLWWCEQSYRFLSVWAILSSTRITYFGHVNDLLEQFGISTIQRRMNAQMSFEYVSCDISFNIHDNAVYLLLWQFILPH